MAKSWLGPSLWAVALVAWTLTSTFDPRVGSEEPTVENEAVETPPLEPAPLRLSATLIDGQQEALAIIDDPLLPGSRAYSEGDSIRPSVVLAKVAGDHVVLRQGEQTRRLEL